MTNIFVSIIVPVYNVEPWLRECVESILGQKAVEMELILVDDGSTDGSPQVCDEYAAKDSRVKAVHKKNGGVSSARNAGLDVAQGEWVWFVDGDDYLMPGVLGDIERRVRACGDCDCVQIGLLYFENGRITKEVGAEECLHMGKNEFLLHYPNYHNHRILFKNTGIMNHNHRFTPGIRLAEDLEFQLKYFMTCQRLVQIPVKAYVYRQREGSAVHSADTEYRKVEDTFKVLSNLCTYIRDNKVQPEPWLQFRIAGMVRSLLYAASKVDGLDRKAAKRRLRDVMNRYASLGFKCMNTIKLRLAYSNLTAYFLLNRAYLRMRGM